MSKTKAHQRYFLKDGSEVAGASTIANMLDKPALLGWAWRLGRDGIDMYKARDKAADIGTIAHYLAECEMKGDKPELGDYAPNDVEKAENSFIGFLDFMKANNLKAIHNELRLVSEQYKFGGTIDIYAEMNNEKALIDIKTSSGIYPEMKLQISGYRQLLIENGYKVDSTHIVRIDKETGAFEHHKLINLDNEWEMFKLMIPIYELKKKVWKKK